MDQRYLSGEEIHIGDRVEYAGFPGRVVLVIDRDEWPDGESMESRVWWRSEYHCGFLLVLDTGGRIFLPDADDNLIFVSRSQAVA
jgi:hypothetical protein